MADVASTQVRTLELQHVSQEKENKSLRQQLLDFQVQSDEKTIIGKFHVFLFAFRINLQSFHQPTSLTSLCTGSFVFLQIHDYFVFPFLEQKPLANAVSPTMQQSNRICSLVTFIMFNPPMTSKLH